jgi:hypothetical protein
LRHRFRERVAVLNSIIEGSEALALASGANRCGLGSVSGTNPQRFGDLARAHSLPR